MADRTVVVTGASAGVGRATANEFAKRGERVALLARGRAGLEAAAEEVERWGGKALAIPTDVADAEQVEAAAEQVERDLGEIDVWVSVAMTTVFSWVWDITPDEYRRATEVTYLGQVYGTMSALRRMRPRDAGSIVSVGSGLAYRAIPLQAPYCGAKFAVRGFMDAVRVELEADGSNIHVASVHLPAVNTPQFSWCRTKLPEHPQPVPPIYQPEVCAKVIADAADDHRREHVIGAANKFQVQLNKVAPRLLDRYLARAGVSSQQTATKVRLETDGNLFEPRDDDCPASAHGVFGDRAHGMATPMFWRSLPHTAATLARAAADRRRAT